MRQELEIVLMVVATPCQSGSLHFDFGTLPRVPHAHEGAHDSSTQLSLCHKACLLREPGLSQEQKPRPASRKSPYQILPPSEAASQLLTC